MMENLEFLEGQVSQEIEEFTDDERTVGKHENVQTSIQHVPSIKPLPKQCAVTNEAKVPDGITRKYLSNSAKHVQLDSLNVNPACVKDDKTNLTHEDANVNCDLQDEEESCDVGVLEKSVLSIKNFNAKYSNPNISAHEFNSKVSSNAPERCLQTASLQANDTHSESTTESTIKSVMSQTLLEHCQYEHSAGISVRPLSMSSISESINPLSGVSNKMASALTNNGTVSYLSHPQGCTTSTPLPAMLGYSHVYDSNGIPCMLIMSGTFNPTVTIPIYGSLCPFYMDPRQHISLTSQGALNNHTTSTEQSSIESQTLPSALGYPSTTTTTTTPITSLALPEFQSSSIHNISTSVNQPSTLTETCANAIGKYTLPLPHTTGSSATMFSSGLLHQSSISCPSSSKIRTVPMLNIQSPSQVHASRESAATPQTVALNNKHIFKTPQKMISNNDMPAQKTSLPKNSTVIRVSPRYSETKGHCSPMVLVSKNVAPLQPIRGNIQQYVITQGHDKHLPKKHQTEKRNENQPIYLKGTPPQGYKRRLLTSGKSKYTRSKKISKKSTLPKNTSQNSAKRVAMTTSSPNDTDTIETIIIPDPEGTHTTMKEDEVHQMVPQMTPTNNQTPVDLKVHTPEVKTTEGSACNKPKPRTSAKLTPKPHNHTTKSEKTPRSRSRPKTPRVEDKDKKRERDHRNCVELRESFEQLCGVLPGSQRSWSRLHILDFTLEYINKIIEKLEGFGVSLSDIYKDTHSDEQETSVVVDSPNIECLQSSENLNNTVSEIMTENGRVRGRWIQLSDIANTIGSNEPMKENSQMELMGEVFVIEVPTDSAIDSILDSALIMNGVHEQDDFSPSTTQVEVVDQCCPQDDEERAIHECCEQLLELQNQLVPGTPSDYNQEIGDTTAQSTGDLSYTINQYGNTSSPEYSPAVLSQCTNEAQYNSSLTGLLSPPVIMIPQVTDEENGHRYPNSNAMSPFIIPSSPEEVLHMYRGISNPMSTEDFSQSPDYSQDNSTPCGVMSDDPLSYVSPFATPKLGFSPTFAELSPGHTVSDNESCHLESPIQSVPINSVRQLTDFNQVGLTTIAASIEVVSTPEPQVDSTTKRKYRKRQVSESPKRRNQALAGKKLSSKRNKTYSRTKTLKHDTENTAPWPHTSTNRSTKDLLKDHNSFKTPSPRNRCSKLKIMKTTEYTPTTTIPRKKPRKEPKIKKSVCKRQIIKPK